MEVVRLIFDFLAIIISVSVFGYSLPHLSRQKTWFLYYVFFFLFGVPLILDYVISKVAYNSWHWYGYHIACNDYLTCCIYSFIVIVVTLLFFFIHKKQEKENNKIKKDNFKKTNKIIKYLFLVVCIAPTIVFFVSSLIFRYNPLIIFNYGWRYRYDSGFIPEMKGYSAAERLTYLSCVTSFILLFSFDYKSLFLKIKKKEFKKKDILSICYLVYLLTCLLLSILIEGKRSILLYIAILFLIGIVIFLLGKVESKKIIIVLAVSVVVLVPLLLFLTTNFRTALITKDAKSYASLRIDFFRDQSLKYAIYSSLHSKEVSIVSYPGQSFFTEIFYLFPIVYLPIPFKQGYEVYLTSSVLFSPVDQMPNMRFTNSIVDELYANFSLFGIIIFILITVWLIKRFNKVSRAEQFFIFASFVISMMYSTAYICWIYEFLLFYFIFKRVCLRFTKEKEPFNLRGGKDGPTR